MSITKRLFGSAGDGVPDPEAVNLAMPADDIHQMFRIERRRMALRYLHRNDAGNGVELGDMATDMAADEFEKPPGEVTGDERKCLYVGLYQAHLPKMDEWGVLEFEGDRGQIYTTERTAEAVAFLDVSDSMADEPATEGPDAKPV